MAVVGSNTPTGGAPKPDPARVAAIRYTIVDEPETCAAFGESARASLASLNDRALAETRSGDLSECSLLVDHVRDRVAGLDPARLQPRTGLAGLFDSRAKRLKAFRTAYASAASAVGQTAADIGDRAGALARKGVALEILWSETRDAITELDAHIAAARGWLANEAPGPVVVGVEVLEVDASLESEAEGRVASVIAVSDRPEDPATPVQATTPAEPAERPEGAVLAGADPTPRAEPETEAEITSDVEPSPATDPLPVATLPHPLETRLAALETVRAVGIDRLPLIRAAQNADLRAPATLKEVCDGVEAWRADWQDALGLAGKRTKKVHPDRVRLTAAASALTDRIDAAGRDLSAAQGRRAELDARAAPAQPSSALAA